VKRKEGSGRAKVRSEEVINNVRQIVQEQPKISVRHLGLQLNIPSTTTHRILKQDLHLYPYRLQVYQELFGLFVKMFVIICYVYYVYYVLIY
jgi:hypothetical protein